MLSRGRSGDKWEKARVAEFKQYKGREITKKRPNLEGYKAKKKAENFIC